MECQCILAGVLIEHAEILSCLPEDKLLSVQTEIEKLQNEKYQGGESAHAVQKFVASEVSKLFMQERGSLLEQLQAPAFREWLHENESFISEHGGPLQIGSKWERVHSVLKTDIEFVNSKLASALLNKRHGTFNRKELDSFGVRTVLVRPLCLFVCVTSASFPYRFPDDRTPIEDTPLSATSTELGLIWGLGLGLDSLSHSSSPPFSFFSPPSFHTLSLSPEFTSVWWSA